MCQADYSLIHLLPEEIRTLRRYSKLDRIPDCAPHLQTFLRLRFVCRVGAVPDSTGVRRGGWYVVTIDGRRYLEYLNDQRNDRRWTRGLAIAAILISLFALILEMDDRGFLGGFLDGFKTTRISTPVEAPELLDQSQAR